MNCPECNAPIPSSGRICPACGTEIGDLQYEEVAGLRARSESVLRRWWKNGLVRKGTLAVAVVLVVLVGFWLLSGGRGSATETLNEFFRLFESEDPDDYYQLENYVLFPTKSEARDALGVEKAEEITEKVKMLKVMLRSGAISLAWKEVQMRAAPASAHLTTREEKNGKDGVVWVNVTMALNGIVMDEERSFPIPMRNENGKWKIDYLCLFKAGEDGTLADLMNSFHGK